MLFILINGSVSIYVGAIPPLTQKAPPWSVAVPHYGFTDNFYTIEKDKVVSLLKYKFHNAAWDASQHAV
jgi:hypothetical protein